MFRTKKQLMNDTVIIQSSNFIQCQFRDSEGNLIKEKYQGYSNFEARSKFADNLIKYNVR